jgi:hypothetical protein
MKVFVDKTLETYLLKLGMDKTPDGFIDVPDELAERYIAVTNHQDAHRPEAERIAKGIAIAYSDHTGHHETPVRRKANDTRLLELSPVVSAEKRIKARMSEIKTNFEPSAANNPNYSIYLKIITGLLFLLVFLSVIGLLK